MGAKNNPVYDPKKEDARIEMLKAMILKVWTMLVAKLKSETLKFAILKILGTAAGGFKLFLVKLGFKLFWDYLGEKGVEFAERKGLLVYDKVSGGLRYRKMNQAKKEGNEEDYDEAIDDL